MTEAKAIRKRNNSLVTKKLECSLSILEKSWSIPLEFIVLSVYMSL